MKRSMIVSTLLVAALGTAVAAQTANLGLAEKVIAARKANAALMHQFTWNSRTELIDQGKVRDIRIDLVQYGPGDELQRTLLNEQGNKHMPIGFLRRAIAKSKKQETEKYLEGLRDLLEQYTLPTAGKVIDFIASADLEFTPDPAGATLLKVSGSDVVVPGDSLTLWADTTTHATRRMQIATTFEGDAVEVNGTFKTLAASHLTYLSLAEVTVPAKKMSLQVQNYDYEQAD